MAEAARRLLDEVLALSEDDRARLVTEVIASLDGPPDGDWEATWVSELDTRIAEAERTGDHGSDWKDVRAELLAELLQK